MNAKECAEYKMLEVSLVCLAMNVYYEARNQSVEAQIAVSEVVMNRVADSRFPWRASATRIRLAADRSSAANNASVLCCRR